MTAEPRLKNDAVPMHSVDGRCTDWCKNIKSKVSMMGPNIIFLLKFIPVGNVIKFLILFVCRRSKQSCFDNNWLLSTNILLNDINYKIDDKPVP